MEYSIYIIILTDLRQRCKIAFWLFKALHPDYIISVELLHIEDTISVYYDFGQGETLAVVQFNYFLTVKLLFLTAKLTSSPSTSLTLSVTLLCMDMMGDVFQCFSAVTLWLFPQQTES